MSPLRYAKTTAWARSCTSILDRTRLTWVFAVDSAITSRSVISGFDRPSRPPKPALAVALGESLECRPVSADGRARSDGRCHDRDGRCRRLGCNVGQLLSFVPAGEMRRSGPNDYRDRGAAPYASQQPRLPDRIRSGEHRGEETARY